jgi:outer membrane immunogenic protein
MSCHWEMLMRRFRCAALAAVAVASFASLASAADMPMKAAPMVAPAFSWTGFYLGGDVGYGWGTSKGQGLNAAGAAGTGPAYNFDVTGGLGGGFLGYNYQINQFVVGVEADWQGADLKGNSPPTLSTSGSGPYTVSTKVTSDGSLRARLGFAADHWLVFATGGRAWGSASTSYGFTGAPIPFYTNSFHGDGWTGGVGAEYAITNNWLARLEYRYTDLGSHTFVNAPANSSETGDRVTVNDVRLGVAYKF